ncbi:hypothetical protein CPB85DRAFT_1339732 [Mucidula mucida]|nr:hypothetical protein CPB85DRAFT_1339732 [Mucidula mucida]
MTLESSALSSVHSDATWQIVDTVALVLQTLFYGQISLIAGFSGFLSRCLLAPLVPLIHDLHSVFFLTTIVIRIAICSHSNPDLETYINYSQTSTLVFSFLTNILATSIIGLKAWKHRQWIRKELSHAPKIHGVKRSWYFSSNLVCCIVSQARLHSFLHSCVCPLARSGTFIPP